MINLASSLKTSLVAGLVSEPTRGEGVRSWISRGRFSIDVSYVDSSLELFAYDPDEAVRSLSAHFERLAFASYESFRLAVADADRFSAVSWSTIKTYYASFFAAHALLRSQGVGQINVDSASASNITTIGRTIDQAFSEFKAGDYDYELRFYPNDRAAFCLTPSSKQGTGVHDRFWRFFVKALEAKAAAAVAEGQPDAVDFFAEASALREAIERNPSGSGCWISSIRNEVNYSQKHDTWLPIRRNAPTRALSGIGLVADPASIRLDLSKDKDVIQSFVNVTRFLANLSRDVVEFLVAQGRVHADFSRRWRALERALA